MPFKNLRNLPEFEQLAALIKAETQGRQVFYIPNRGNWGDALIHTGTVQFLKFFKIAFTQISREDFLKVAAGFRKSGAVLKDGMLLAGGGGAWCENYPGSRNLVQDHLQMFERIIVLPTTYELPPIGGAGKKITYVARDKAESLERIPGARFCHDMAFFLEVSDLDLSKGRRDGHFFREDKEQHPDRPEAPVGSFDISSLANESKSVRPFFQILSAYRTINTDRMHVAIAGSMMGIPTVLTPGNYFKSSAVFRSSIKPHFPKTELLAPGA